MPQSKHNCECLDFAGDYKTKNRGSEQLWIQCSRIKNWHAQGPDVGSQQHTHTKNVFSRQVDIETKENDSNEKNQCSVRKYIKFH